ncbi:MAG: polymer-forming cytoskeletal protein [Acidobacteria bacterium]|nr:polymer-forming cytoskeletal protein [Acidobacteriota bacterium]
MWNRRREEESLPRPSSQPPLASDLAREGIPMSTMPARGADIGFGDRTATIGKSVVVKGQLFSREDLYIDGEVEGSIEMQESKLTVGPNGRVQAGIKAREIVALGTIHGNVEVGDKIDIRKDAKLVGDIRTVRIVIEDGAYFKGSIDIAKPEVKPAARPAQIASAQPAQPATATAGETKR